MEHAKIKLSKLVQNDGQIEGLPKNPRQCLMYSEVAGQHSWRPSSLGDVLE